MCQCNRRLLYPVSTVCSFVPLEVGEYLCDVLHPGEVVAAVRAHKLLDERPLHLGVLLLDGRDGSVELFGRQLLRDELEAIV